MFRYCDLGSSSVQLTTQVTVFFRDEIAIGYFLAV